MAEKKKREVLLPPAPVPPPQSDPAQPKAQGPGSLRSMPRLAEQIPASILQTLSPNEVQRQEVALAP